MELRVAIVDDLSSDRERLTRDLRAYFATRPDINFSLQAYTSAEELLGQFKPKTIDLVFLDICMGGLNGVQLANLLRADDTHLLIVFLTTSREFMLDAFPVHPFDYLIKPYGLERLQAVLAEALRVLALEEPCITLRVPRGEREIPLDQLCAIESRGHAVEVKLTDGTAVRSIMTFSELEKLLVNDERFLRCNRGVIVNMDHVKTLDGDVFKMKDGSAYPLRVRNRAELVTRFSQYMISRME